MRPCDGNKQVSATSGRGLSRRGGPRRRRAFSLAELMIALAILGMGLLVIAAALPAGARYQKQSTDMSNGAAAAEAALDLIEQNVCLRKKVLDTSGNLVAPVLFQPRKTSDSQSVSGTYAIGEAIPTYEPWIKVRPLLTQNINVTRGTLPGNVPLYLHDIFDPNNTSKRRNWVEECIETTFITKWGGSASSLQGLEYDPTATGGPSYPWMRPALPALALFYPPVSQDVYGDLEFGHIRSPQQFLPSPTETRDYTVEYRVAARTPEETSRALERPIVWTAFYRRVSYATGSDPYLYEVIVIASRRPTAQHRYPVQDPTVGMFSGSAFARQSRTAPSYYKVDTAAPVPWLVAFKTLPQLQKGTDFAVIDADEAERVLYSGFQRKPLVFVADSLVGQLLPPGSVFIPAVNDTKPVICGGKPWAGFVPSAPDVLPIFEVAERTDNGDGTYRITVKDNGYYPWLRTGLTSPDYWPVWVIPPATDTFSGGQPVFPDQSPVLAVARRYIHIREFP